MNDRIIDRCNHIWETIRVEEGRIHHIFFSEQVMIYHLRCKKCGDIIERKLDIACRKCPRETNSIQSKGGK